MSLNVRRKPYFSLPKDRKLIHQEVNQIKKYLEQNKKIYIVYNNINSEDCLTFVYETAPYSNFINGCPNYSTHKETKNTIEEYLINNIKLENFHDKFQDNDPNKYDILYIIRSDNSLWQKIKRKFNFTSEKPENYTLFIRNNEQFEPVQ